MKRQERDEVITVSHYVSKYAKCPYYKWHEENCICCEGTERSNGIHLIFRTESALRAYSKKYCNDMESYRKCLLCKMQDERYGNDT